MSPYNAFNRHDPSADTRRTRKIVFPRVFRAFSRVFGPKANRKIALQPKIGLQIALIGLLAVTGTGCASGTKVSTDKLQYKADRSAYYDQERTSRLVVIETDNDSWFVGKGRFMIEVYAPLRELGQPNMPDNAWSSFWRAASDMTRSIVTGVAGYKIVDSLSTPVQPVTVPTQVIEQPVLVTP